VEDQDLAPVSLSKQEEYLRSVVEQARAKLTRYLPRAVEIITELAETSENDRVRLAAAQDIADRTGLTKSTTTNVQVSDSEHEAARREAEELVKRIEENQLSIAQTAHEISLEALIVHEGDVDPVPTHVGHTPT
jgi:hypothetical protein